MQAARLATRLQREVRMLQSEPPPGVCAWPCNDTLSHLEAQIQGPDDTVYAKGIFKLEVLVPERYPFEPPNVRFRTPIYHPNIDSGGRICLDILNMPPKGAWKPSLNIPTILSSIGLLLSEPNPDDGLMGDITAEYKHNRASFDVQAKKCTGQYAVQNASVEGAHQTGKSLQQDAGEQDNSTTNEATLLTKAKKGTGQYGVQNGSADAAHQKGKFLWPDAGEQDNSTTKRTETTPPASKPHTFGLGFCEERAQGISRGLLSSTTEKKQQIATTVEDSSRPVSSNQRLNLSMKLSYGKGPQALERESASGTAATEASQQNPSIDNTHATRPASAQQDKENKTAEDDSRGPGAENLSREKGTVVNTGVTASSSRSPCTQEAEAIKEVPFRLNKLSGTASLDLRKFKRRKEKSSSDPAAFSDFVEQQTRVLSSPHNGSTASPEADLASEDRGETPKRVSKFSRAESDSRRQRAANLSKEMRFREHSSFTTMSTEVDLASEHGGEAPKLSSKPTRAEIDSRGLGAENLSKAKGLREHATFTSMSTEAICASEHRGETPKQSSKLSGAETDSRQPKEEIISREMGKRVREHPSLQTMSTPSSPPKHKAVRVDNSIQEAQKLGSNPPQVSRADNSFHASSRQLDFDIGPRHWQALHMETQKLATNPAKGPCRTFSGQLGGDLSSEMTRSRGNESITSSSKARYTPIPSQEMEFFGSIIEEARSITATVSRKGSTTASSAPLEAQSLTGHTAESSRESIRAVKQKVIKSDINQGAAHMPSILETTSSVTLQNKVGALPTLGPLEVQSLSRNTTQSPREITGAVKQKVMNSDVSQGAEAHRLSILDTTSSTTVQKKVRALPTSRPFEVQSLTRNTTETPRESSFSTRAVPKCTGALKQKVINTDVIHEAEAHVSLTPETKIRALPTPVPLKVVIQDSAKVVSAPVQAENQSAGMGDKTELSKKASKSNPPPLIVLDSESDEEEPPKGKSRLSLANRKGMKRKFPVSEKPSQAFYR